VRIFDLNLQLVTFSGCRSSNLRPMTNLSHSRSAGLLTRRSTSHSAMTSRETNIRWLSVQRRVVLPSVLAESIYRDKEQKNTSGQSELAAESYPTILLHLVAMGRFASKFSMPLRISWNSGTIISNPSTRKQKISATLV
jgi:hypothetical protein